MIVVEVEDWFAVDTSIPAFIGVFCWLTGPQYEVSDSQNRVMRGCVLARIQGGLISIEWRCLWEKRSLTRLPGVTRALIFSSRYLDTLHSSWPTGNVQFSGFWDDASVKGNKSLYLFACLILCFLEQKILKTQMQGDSSGTKPHQLSLLIYRCSIDMK